MKIGDIAVPVVHALHSGSRYYDCAVVASTEPFVLVSEEADMLWMTKHPIDFVSYCQAPHETVVKAVRRAQKHLGLPEGVMMVWDEKSKGETI